MVKCVVCGMEEDIFVSNFVCYRCWNVPQYERKRSIGGGVV